MLQNDLIGHPTSEPKPADTLRLYFGNPNRLTLDARGGDFREYLDLMKHIEVDIIGLFEHNLDTQKASVKLILYETCHNMYDHSKAVFTSSAIPSVSQFKPGGTLFVAQGQITTRIHSSGHDSYGR
jgi:hypothetical protein